jgi:hypothetical protein
LAQKCLQSESEKVELGNGGALGEGVEVRCFDFTENFGASQPSESDFPRERPGKVTGKGFSLAKEFPGPFRLVTEAVAEIGSHLTGKELLFGDA